MPNNAFLNFGPAVEGESIVTGKEKWVQINNWSWVVENQAGASSTSGGSGIGKIVPGKLVFDHAFDSASPALLSNLCSAKPFAKVELQVMKTLGGVAPQTYFTMTLENALITKISNECADDGVVMQTIEMSFATVKIDYKPASQSGLLGADKIYGWDFGRNVATVSGAGTMA